MNKPASFPSLVAGPARFTTDEFVRIFTVGLQLDIRLELVDGVVERMSPPQGAHSSRQTSLVAILWAVVGNRTMVEAGIDLGNATVLTCDLAILVAPMAERRFLSPNEVVLAIEVSETTLSRDMGMKRVKYATAGIAHYWVIDGERSVVHVWGEPVNGDYAQIGTVRFGEPLAVPGTDQTIVID